MTAVLSALLVVLLGLVVACVLHGCWYLVVTRGLRRTRRPATCPACHHGTDAHGITDVCAADDCDCRR